MQDMNQIDTAHAAGHHNIGKDQIDLPGMHRDKIDRVLTTCRDHGSISEVVKLRDDHAAYIGVVLDHQNHRA
jgi:hypothetical protein